VRVQELTPTSMTLMTLEGHPLAGAVRFLCEESGGRLRFEVRVYDRAANVIDWLAMGTVGGRVQNATWRQLVENVLKESGGESAAGVQQEERTLTDEQAGEVEEWLEGLVVARKREERA
jgi:NADH dehydrogenase